MRRMLLGLLVSSLWLASATAFAQEDIGQATENVCCGSTCCLIDGDCRATGETNPLNECQSCQPGTSQRAWSNVAGCTPRRDAGTGGGGGGGCSATATPSTSASLAGVWALGLALAGFAFRRRR
jgi:MYXO-CTERM domain-containing protein